MSEEQDTELREIKASQTCRRASKRDCDIVREALEDARRLRDAFADPALLRLAKDSGWDGSEYQDAVLAKAFGDDQPEVCVVPVSPMGTEPWNCILVERQKVWDYISRGDPTILYIADREHEEVHIQDCKRAGGYFAANISTPEGRSRAEIRAYSQKITILEGWLKESCQGL